MRILSIISCCLASFLAPGVSAENATFTWKDIERFPEMTLRGYGAVSGQLRESSDNSVSVLSVTSKSEADSELLQAKYISDLLSLPGVVLSTLHVGDAELDVYQAEKQGWIAVSRENDTTSVIIARDAEVLASAITNIYPEGLDKVSFVASVDVPMWLNRWDRFGFRFYYRPWELPKDASRDAYDVTEEFDFAEKSDRAGFVFWQGMDSVDTAAGLAKSYWFDWALEQAVERDLPVGLNIVLSNVGATWFYNQWRENLQEKAPQFSGNKRGVADPGAQANGALPWSGGPANDAAYAYYQQNLRQALAKAPTATTVLEPHDELRHGHHDLFLEYGPAANVSYQTFLHEKYDSLKSLNASWLTDFSSWAQISLPELAEFAGWGTDALDLRGTWRVGLEDFAPEAEYTRRELTRLSREAVKTVPAPEEWFNVDFDDSDWPTIVAPGNDQAMFTEARPAVFRTTFSVNDTWLNEHPRVWLYVWDLTLAQKDTFQAYVNGQKVGEDTLAHFTPHWGAYEVTGALRSGENQISLRLPRGRMAYRIYLSGVEPKQYPDLGEGLNQRWVDFSDWVEWSRLKEARRGMEVIRQVDPNIQIDLMAPDHYADGVKTLARDYGGNFKNTGHMGAFWNDYLPSMMRGARLPFSLEPGWPAPDLTWFKKQMGLWATEGIQGIDYFIHIGSVMWREDIRANFEENLASIRMIGKYHAPEAQVAALYPTTISAKTGFPWGFNPNVNLGGGYWNWNVRAFLVGHYESDGLTESSFAQGDAARYRVIIDTNTSIMDDALISDIEKYVRDGGTFVTFVQTGRHSPAVKDAWPISRLTGFQVTAIDPLNSDGETTDWRHVTPAPNQTVFSGDWSRYKAIGQSMSASSPDAVPLMLWDDGSVAIGYRRLGDGYIVQVGCRFNAKGMPDRLTKEVDQNFTSGETSIQALSKLFGSLLKWRDVTPIQAHLTPSGSEVRLRHYESNNGLYDVWVLWNQKEKDAFSGTLRFSDDEKAFPTFAYNIKEDALVAITSDGLPIQLQPLEFSVWLSPKVGTGAFLRGAADWFSLQRDWWRREAADPFGKPVTPIQPVPGVDDLTDDWAFKTLANAPSDDVVSGWASAEFDDSSWDTRRLGVWLKTKGESDTYAVFRKTFTIPKDWTKGTAGLWIQSWLYPTFVDDGRVWIDGKPIGEWTKNGVHEYLPADGFVPGSSHTVLVEIRQQGVLGGVRANAWLWLNPAPSAELDISGEWDTSQDMLRYDGTVTLPGEFEAFGLRHHFELPEDWQGSEVYIDAVIKARIIGVLINGHWVREFYHDLDDRLTLNITPWVEFGAENEIQLVSIWNGPTSGEIDSVSILQFPTKIER